MSNNWLSSRAAFVARVLMIFGLAASTVRADLVLNGGFEITTHGPGEFDSYTQAIGWTSTYAGPGDQPYNFIFAPGTADTTGSWGDLYNAYLQLWGPGNGSGNGLPPTSPAGGNFVGADPAFHARAIQQTIPGLTVGDTYTLGFYWAGAQQFNYDGQTTMAWHVNFGDAPYQNTPFVINDPKGFTGWQHATMNFTATATSEVLSFLALGGPEGPPPFALLDGVSLTDSTVPEASSVLVWGGIIGLGAVLRLRRRAQPAKA